MAYYDKEEQETIYNYDAIDDVWYVYSTYPPDIKRILKQTETPTTTEDEDGKVIVVNGVAVRSQVRLFR